MRLNKLILLSSLVLGCGFLTAYGTWKTNGVDIIAVQAYTNGDADTYYSDINADELTPAQLLSALQSLNNTKLKSRVGYDQMKSKFVYTDPGVRSGEVTSFYSGNSATYSGNMNREHVWPASRTVGGRDNDPLEDDIHMTRPTLISENSARGNSFFAESGAWDPASFDNPSYRGDAARIIFYCVVADSRLSLVDKTNDGSGNHTMGKLSDMLKWNLEYPVQARERTRNEEAEKLQGNRNPFIDHPEWANYIWGDGDVPPIPPVEDELNSITLSVHEKSKEVEQTFKLAYTTDPADYSGKLVWKSSNTSIASITEDGQITTLKVGMTNITLSNEDGTIKDTCLLKVMEKGSGGKSNDSGCGGSILAPSVIVSVASILGVAFLLVKKYRFRKDS